MVVVLILGALAAFAIPRFHKVAEQAKAAEAWSYASAFRNAQDMYFSAHGTYCLPTSADTPVLSGYGPNTGYDLSFVSSCPGWNIGLPVMKNYDPYFSFNPPSTWPTFHQPYVLDFSRKGTQFAATQGPYGGNNYILIYMAFDNGPPAQSCFLIPNPNSPDSDCSELAPQ